MGSPILWFLASIAEMVQLDPMLEVSSHYESICSLILGKLQMAALGLLGPTPATDGRGLFWAARPGNEQLQRRLLPSPLPSQALFFLLPPSSAFSLPPKAAQPSGDAI